MLFEIYTKVCIVKILNLVPTKIVKIDAGDPGDQLLLVQWIVEPVAEERWDR